LTHCGLKIAVCGHRRLSDQGRLEITILAAAARIRAVFPGWRYQVCSCLAEGVENCDLLVAIWDGEPARGPGGTGETVELFRQAGRPLLWIHASQGPLAGSLVEESLESLS
jgi:hypothetical protein